MAGVGAEKRLLSIAEFPNLKNYDITSPFTEEYNCIAWAFADNTKWWWPNGFAYWPPGFPCTNSVQDFDNLLVSVHASTVDDDGLESGFLKIALFAKGKTPTHAARQLPNGRWTSKLGRSVDVSHDLRDLEGLCYGQVIRIYRLASPAS